MKKLFVLTTFLMINSIFASFEIVEECKIILEETCQKKDLESCMKLPSKNKNFETCLGILLPEATVPPQVLPLQSSNLFDANKAPCFTAVAQGCGNMEIDVCMKEKGNIFSAECRDLFFGIEEQQKRMASISGHCFKKYLDSCQQMNDVPLTSYEAFLKGLKSTESCISGKLQADNSCVKDISDSAKKRNLEREKKIEEEKSKEIGDSDQSKKKD